MSLLAAASRIMDWLKPPKPAESGKKESIINLVLLGKTGNGKSATGNTILKTEAFQSMPSPESVTLNCQLGSNKIKDRSIRVVDTPGLMDTRITQEKVLQQIFNAMSLCPEGINAFLYVIKFGQRYTREENETLKFLKEAFGEEFIKKYCILIMTGGDNFELTCSQNKSFTFESWLKYQQGPKEFVQLLNECQERIVLFYNLGDTYKEQREKSLEKLFTLINKISGFYTSPHFRKCVEQREKLIEEFKLPVQKHNVQLKLSEISLNIQNILNTNKEVKKEKNRLIKIEKEREFINMYEKLQSLLETLLKEINTEEKKTPALEILIKEVHKLKEQVETLKVMSDDKEEQTVKSLYEKVESLKNQGAAQIQKGFKVHKTVIGGLMGSTAGLGVATFVGGLPSIAAGSAEAIGVVSTIIITTAGASVAMSVGAPILVLGVAGAFIGYYYS